MKKRDAAAAAAAAAVAAVANRGSHMDMGRADTFFCRQDWCNQGIQRATIERQ